MSRSKSLDDILRPFGIELYGVVNDSIPSSYPTYRSWISRGDHGELSYLADERCDKRENIKNYFPEFEQALVMAFDYSKSSKIMNEFYNSSQSNGLKIASYVLGFEGMDYHFFVRDKLNEISSALKEIDESLEIQFTLDTQPILERDLAYKPGLGWFGKNSMLINQKKGSFFIIGSLLLSKKMFQKEETLDVDHCGNCTKCIDLCPTNAIDKSHRTIIADKCISTYTIELFKDAKAPKGFENSGGEIYGCDICQDVCPWNIKVMKSLEISDSEKENFYKKNDDIISTFLKPSIDSIINFLETLSNRKYRKKFHSSPIARTGRIGMLKNLRSIFSQKLK